MPKAVILTVGSQAEQIKFMFKKIKPEYVGIIGTKTKGCKKAIDEIFEHYKISPTKHKKVYVKDDPSEISNVINNFLDLYDWLKKEEKLKDKDIVVDPTGGRKWMSAGLIIIASFYKLNMIYDHVEYKRAKPDKNIFKRILKFLLQEECKSAKPDETTMEVLDLDNAYENIGLLEEAKADKLFNSFNYASASKIYNTLSKKVYTPDRLQKLKIKNDISLGLNYWFQFDFNKAYNKLNSAYKKIERFTILPKYKRNLNNYLTALTILKQNKTFFELIKDEEFFKYSLLTLLLKSKICENTNQLDEATIIQYRILELISQHRLALYGIDVSKVDKEVRNKYSKEFKKLFKEVFDTEKEIPPKVALLDSWILLYIIKDEIVKNEQTKFLKGMKGKVSIRNDLWLEHGNKSADKINFKKFKSYVAHFIKKIGIKLPDENKYLIKF